MKDSLLSLISNVFENQASDIILIEGEIPRVRKAGVLSVAGEELLSEEDLEQFWDACGVDTSQKSESDVSWRLPGGGRLRVNLYKTLGRLAAVMRPITDEIPEMAELSLPSKLLESWMGRPYGLVLITGPTGCGKSTTVASCLDWINRTFSKHIITLEDPIEYLFKNGQSFFSQREVRRDSDGFASGLRSSLRQSPDVLFIGEIRDAETAITALHAAETGHLVISTMHSSSVAETVDRFIHLIGAEAGSALQLLASQLIGVMSQQLLPRAGGGMFPALEYMQNQAATRRWIAEGKMDEIQEFMWKASDPTHCSFLNYLVASVNEGYISAEVARGVCARPKDFDRVMRGIH